MANIKRNVSNAALRGHVYKTNVSTVKTIISALYDKHKEQFYFNGGLNTGKYTNIFNSVVRSRGGSLTDAELGYLRTFEASLGSDITEFDRLWIHGLSDPIAAKTSFVNPSSTMITAVNSPTFTASQGFTGNGSTSYLNSHYIPSIDANKYTLNSASYGMYQRIDLGSTYYSGSMGAYSFISGYANYTYLLPCFGNLFYFDVNNITSDNYYSNTISKGFYVANRTGSLTTQAILNGSVLNTGNIVSSNLINYQLYLLGINGQNSLVLPSANQISLSFIGSGAINQSNFYNSVQTLGTSLGWAV